MSKQEKRVDIGGQAVMEGVMMRSPEAIAIAVRKPDGSIAIQHKPYISPAKKHKWMGWPFVRGVVSLVTMLTSGMNTLETSANMLGTEEEEPTKFEKWLSEKLGKDIDKVIMGVAVVLAVVLSLGLFVVIPSVCETFFESIGVSVIGTALLGGLVKILILIGYMVFCGAVPDVRRTFQYHGAEHKTVYCHEADLPLKPENAQQFTTLHPRCGTAFLLIVFFVSILLFAVTSNFINGLPFIANATNKVLKFLYRFLLHLALLPFVSGISYEILKGLAHSESTLAKVLRWPGMQMQRLTTRQPDDKMLECAIVAMNCALYGLPQGKETTPEGYTLIHDYREADPVLCKELEEQKSE